MLSLSDLTLSDFQVDFKLGNGRNLSISSAENTVHATPQVSVGLYIGFVAKYATLSLSLSPWSYYYLRAVTHESSHKGSSGVFHQYI
jgi:hypothetical protein